MSSLYNLFTYALQWYFKIGKNFKSKLNAGYKGRKNWREQLLKFKQENTGKLIWFHCASLGEFEMARPVIDRINQNPLEDSSILITFFSPSGYESKKDYKGVDGVLYLPIDTPQNAKDFISISNPHVAIFVKYEFWLNVLKELEAQKINALLINGLFRPQQAFFKPIGREFRNVLKTFDHIFLQNNASNKLLQDVGITQNTVTGDLRYDRVQTIAASVTSFPQLESFLKDGFVIVGGSTWPEEEMLLEKLLECTSHNLKLILVPHDISEGHLQKIEKQFSQFVLYRFSQMRSDRKPQIVLVDTMGQLSSLYHCGNMAFVGGGFTGALHNILEPAVYGIPVLFGSTHYKFPEAAYFVKEGIGFPVNSSADLKSWVDQFINEKDALQKVKASGARVFKANSGGTDQVYYKVKGFYTLLPNES